MAHTDTNVNNLKINRGTYQAIQQNIDSIGENELIITTDKAVPVPSNNDIGKVVSVDSNGEYTLSTTFINPMTTRGDIIYCDANGTATRLPKGTAGQVLTMNNVAPCWANADVRNISTQYIRITSLTAGVYKLTYSGTKYIYYNGYSSTNTHTVEGGDGTVILIVSQYSTTYWHWWYINGTTGYATLYYGYTSSSSGSTGSKSINSLYTGTPSNYYPIRSYTSGLQISSYSGSTNCQLYVPYATYGQYGVVKPAYSTSGTATLTTSSTSYSDSPTINERTTTAGKYYAVEKDSAGRLYVNVPWEGGSGGNPVQDLTSNTAGTVASTDWTTLKTSHYHVISSPTMTGLDSTYEFVNIKLSINSNNQYVKLNKNTTNKYSGMFYIEESTNLYEIAVYYNGTNIILRCATVY